MVFTDNGSKDLNLKDEILRLKLEKDLEIYIVLTPEYEGRPSDPSLKVYHEIAEVFNIINVGAETFIDRVREYEEANCI